MTNGQDQAAPAWPLNGVRVIDLSAVLMGPRTQPGFLATMAPT
jgi:crotonobetainyl-CoA:carnitine CoA-transferase CaiB-like acyl-CoA transferase